ncbi:MAG: YdeI/OmpD-associated family protein [Bacteroidota bacterium]
MEPLFFETPADFRAWLQIHHTSEEELWVGVYKKKTGKPTITLLEAIPEALCFGWIDGKTRSLGEEAYAYRFTPRKPGSSWSAGNLKAAKELMALGLMEPAGIHAFETRGPDRVEIPLAEEYEARLKAQPAAWEYFEKLPPGKKKDSVRWVMQPKRQATRDQHFDVLLACCLAGERIPVVR